MKFSDVTMAVLSAWLKNRATHASEIWLGPDEYAAYQLKLAENPKFSFCGFRVKAAEVPGVSFGHTVGASSRDTPPSSVMKDVFFEKDTDPEIVEAVYAALRRGREQVPASQWQPIETAPKDCHVLVFCPDDHNDPFRVAWFSSSWEEPFSHGEVVDSNMTHWMPIPPPP